MIILCAINITAGRDAANDVLFMVSCVCSFATFFVTMIVGNIIRKNGFMKRLK